MTEEIRRFEMQDPAKVLEAKQERQRRSCAGCKEIRVVANPFDGRGQLRCKLGNPVGQRCNSYQERTSHE